MPCGDDNVILLSQFTPDGDYQESTDGGETYHDAPAKDPRNSVTIPPPFLPPDTEEAECTYADSIVNQFINAWINATGEGEDTATVIEGMLSFLAGILGAVGGIVAAIVLAIAASVVATTVVAWKAAFTSDVWDRFRCNLHDNQQADGSFTASDVDAIYSRLGDEETGIVLISLRQMVAALGWQGLTISARSGFGSPNADCCGTEACDHSDWFVYDANAGIINTGTRTATFVEIESQIRGDGKYYVIFLSPDADQCCDLINSTVAADSQIDAVVGAASLAYYNPCGDDPANIVLGTYPMTVGTYNANAFLFRGDSTFTLQWDTES